MHSGQNNIIKEYHKWIIIFTPKKFTDFYEQNNARIYLKIRSCYSTI